MRSLRVYLTLWTSIILFSCGDEYQETTRAVAPPPFTRVEIRDVFTVYLVQDTVHGVEIAGDEGMVNYVDVEVQDGSLILINNSRNKWMHPKTNKVKVFIHTPGNLEIEAYATYSLYSTNTISSDLSIGHHASVRFSDIDLTLDNSSFYYWNNYMCGGNLTLRGQSEHIAINNFALHAVNASDLRARSGVVSSYARADTRVQVSGQLKCRLHGQGNIYVYGNPDELVVEEHTSSGQVIRVD